MNFLGQNWLVVTDVYTKYPCIHPTSSVSSKSTIDLLEEDFAHFGYPHAIVSNNATSFTSEEFQDFCKDKGIVHLTGAPYHPETNGAAERLIQTFKQALRKSSKTPKKAMLEFLMQYRRTPTANGYSPSELLNNRQLRAKIDTLVPSPAHMMQAKGKSSFISNTKRVSPLKVGDHCYALLFGNRRNKEPRWVPATIVKKKGVCMFHVRIFPNGPVWRRHLDQLRPRYFSSEDHDPEEDSSNTRVPSFSSEDCRTPDPGETAPFANNARFSSEDCRTPDPGEPPHATISGNLLPISNSGTDVPPASRNDNANAENALSAPSFESVSDTNNAGIQYSRENPRRSNRNRKFPAHLHDFV